MKLETKFNIGDQVLFIIGDEFVKGKVGIIMISEVNKVLIIKYKVKYGYTQSWFYSNALFATKEELLASL